MNKKIKITGLVLALSLSIAACANDNAKDNGSNGSMDNTSTETSMVTTPSMETAGSSETMELSDVVLHRAYAAPNGDRSVARIVVLTSKDKIIDLTLDELQYFDESEEVVALPNSDKAFGEGAAEGKVLGTKLENNEMYSNMMKEFAGSTVTIADNYQAIVDFVKGKTISEIEEAIASKNEDGTVDAVTGATLKDTANYLQAIVDTAKDEKLASNVLAENPDQVQLHQIFGAAHGDKSVADVVVATENGVIVGASIDEFQYFGENGLVNSDKEFGKGFADATNQLASKLEANEAYSALMNEKAKATNSIKDNYNAIERFVVGKTADEVQSIVDENEAGKPVDAVSEATLVDTVGYLQVIVDAVNK